MQASSAFALPKEIPRTPRYVAAMEHLVQVVQELSHARDMRSVTRIVRTAARELTGADGATFVLMDGDKCHYVDEDAIAPLWKGQRFPMSACISGWVMLNKHPAVIEDIYQDPRIPHEAYRPTFVKSLAMVPIRQDHPIGAIGLYWAENYRPSEEELHIIQALANTTAVAIENAQLYDELEHKVKSLQESNHELSRFAWVASHDLQEPLRTIITQVELLQKRYADELDARAGGYIKMATEGASRLQHLIDELLVHARTEKIEKFRPIALGNVLKDVLKEMEKTIASRDATIECGDLPWVWGDPSLLARLLQNLLSNAIKFHESGSRPHVSIGCEQQGNNWLCHVRDNGIGIPEQYLQRVFGLFQRLHTQDRFAGSGIGLATCKKVVELHNGRIWLESAPGKGSCFYFTLPVPETADKAMRRIVKS